MKDGELTESGDEVVLEDGDLASAAEVARQKLATLRARHRRRGELTGVSFGYKSAWIALKGAEHQDVVCALGLQQAEATSWRDGVERARASGCFVTPLTSGWILAVGADLFDPPPDVVGLSASLRTEVQGFATHRVSDAHRWELARNGVLIRQLTVVDGQVAVHGDATDAEQRLGLDALPSEEAIDRISEDVVMNVARAWSLDPRALDTTRTSSKSGTYGKFPLATQI